MTLDIIGVGLSVESLYQDRLIDALKKNPDGLIFPPSALPPHPSSRKDKELAVMRRGANAVISTLENFVHQWPIPTVTVGASRADVGNHALSAVENVSTFLQFANLPHRKSVSAGLQFSNTPEGVMDRVFSFFEITPDLPALLILASDGDITREFIGDDSRNAHWGGGARRYDCMVESMAALLVARRDRVDAMRPFAVPAAQREAGARVVAGFKPGKFVAEPWSVEQIRHFDSLPTLAILHRPIRIGFCRDSEGKIAYSAGDNGVAMKTPERQATFKEAFDDALKLIPGGKPARIFYDAGRTDPSSHLVSLSLAANASLPEIDLHRSPDGIDICRRIGDTGATSPFVQWALAALESSMSRSASMTLNLRQRDEATITAILPAPPRKEKAPPAKAQPKLETPAIIPIPQQIDLTRTVAIGAKLYTGAECTQSGTWRCDPPDAQAGATHYIQAGRKLPPVRIPRNLTVWQKARGESELELVSATYTLVSYEAPNI